MGKIHHLLILSYDSLFELDPYFSHFDFAHLRGVLILEKIMQRLYTLLPYESLTVDVESIATSKQYPKLKVSSSYIIVTSSYRTAQESLVIKGSFPI
jgi:hypothetical protein